MGLRILDISIVLVLVGGTAWKIFVRPATKSSFKVNGRFLTKKEEEDGVREASNIMSKGTPSGSPSDHSEPQTELGKEAKQWLDQQSAIRDRRDKAISGASLQKVLSPEVLASQQSLDAAIATVHQARDAQKVYNRDLNKWLTDYKVWSFNLTHRTANLNWVEESSQELGVRLENVYQYAYDLLSFARASHAKYDPGRKLTSWPGHTSSTGKRLYMEAVGAIRDYDKLEKDFETQRTARLNYPLAAIQQKKP